MKVDYLSDEEYAQLGLTSGIEIHQQIKTSKKLFCRCPVIMHRDNDFDALSADKAFNVLMGDIMRACSLRLEPREVAKALRTALNKAYEQA